MSTVTRLTRTREDDMSGTVALFEFARDIMAGQARTGAPTVRICADGRISLTYPNGERVHYMTDMDTSVPVRRA